MDVDYNIIEEIWNKTKEEIEAIDPINILLVGKTGVGKSTLINNLFREKLAKTGIGRPVTDHVTRIAKEGVPMVLYDSKGLELDSMSQTDVMDELFQLIEEKSRLEPDDQIHLAYYCISATSSRVEDREVFFIRGLAQRLPVIVVLTQSIGKSAAAMKDYIETLDLPIEGVITLLAESYEINDEVTISPFGLRELVALSLDVLPEERHQAFNNAQQVDIQRKVQAAKRWASTYQKTTFGVGFAPIPFSDASILVPMQVTMLAHITAIFGLSVDKATIAGLIGAIGGTGGATYAGRFIVSNLLKLIPGAGTMAGSLISGATAAAVTSVLANSYIELLALIAMTEKNDQKINPETLAHLFRERLQANFGRSKKGGKRLPFFKRKKSGQEASDS